MAKQDKFECEVCDATFSVKLHNEPAEGEDVLFCPFCGEDLEFEEDELYDVDWIEDEYDQR